MSSSKTAVRPSLFWVYAKPWRIIAFGMGSGLLYPGPGTWGTAWGWLVWLLALQFIPWIAMPLFLGFAFMLGVWVCQRTGDDLNVHDHGGMVWDEAVAFWLILWLLPLQTWWMQLLAFALFRLFDIAKPYPIRYFDHKVGGGIGVMLDDILAAIYSLIVLYIMASFI